MSPVSDRVERLRRVRGCHGESREKGCRASAPSSPVHAPADPTLRIQHAAGNQAIQRLRLARFPQTQLTVGEPEDSYEQEAERVAAEVTRTAPGPMVQRRCTCGGIPGADGECAACRRERAKSQIKIQAKSMVNTPGDIYEQEADGVSERVMRMPEPQLQRPCACGGGCPKSQTEKLAQEHERLQTKHVGSGDLEQTAVPPLVHEVLSAPGQPLDSQSRDFFESRFGYDFSGVRVHAEARAAESARSVNALAYTVGRDVVFGAGQYAPQSFEGGKLLAHELTHTVQQSADAPPALTPNFSDSIAPTPSETKLQRACISDPECAPATPSALPGTAVKGSATHFSAVVEKEVQERAEEEKVKTPREIRKELCDKVPPDPACTADGHGRRAAAFEELFRPYAPTQLALAQGVFVDKDMPKGYGAYVRGCQYFVPKIEGEECVFIPEHLEKEAELYNKGDKKIAGWDREDWLTHRLSTITHELEHVRFRKEFVGTEPRADACKFADVSHELSEFSAIMSEFPVIYRASAGKSWSARRSALDTWFENKITKPSTHGERIAGILKALRCRCECEDVNAYVKRAVEFTTASWTIEEKQVFHTELRDPKWRLDWPIETTVPPRDVPWFLLTPSLQIGYGYLGSSGVSLGFGLDVGVPVDRLGKWQLLVGAQGRIISGLTGESRTAYLLGLKVGFLKGPALGSSGWQYGAVGEIGKGSFESIGKKEEGAYAGAGLTARYSAGLVGLGSIMPFVGVDVLGGARIDTTKPDVQKLFSAGLMIGGEF